DKTNASAELNETKRRIIDECAASGVLCWLTGGREIENYLTSASISAAYNQVTGTTHSVSFGRYSKIETVIKRSYTSGWRAGFAYEKDKPSYARKIVAEIAVIPNRFDLTAKVNELVERIRAAN